MSQENNNGERSLHAGDDREFERTWWRVEVGVWIFLTLLIVVAATGLLGRGPMAKKIVRSYDGRLVVEYERIGRFKTPSSMLIQISPGEFKGGEASLWVNNAIVKQMGLQRVIPVPGRAEPGPDGVTYTWPVSDGTKTFAVRLDLQPDKPGIFPGELGADAERVGVRSLTFP